MLNDRLLTSYLFSPELAKPIFYPIYFPSGIRLNRGYPLKPDEGESQDHPHHIGLWFACDEVNGQHFWKSTEPPPQILHDAIVKMECVSNKGYLTTISYWNDEDDISILKEMREIVFEAIGDNYSIDFTFILEAIDTTVIFNDTKEGLFAIRIADWLNEKDGTGQYVNNNGEKWEKGVWGKRASWVKLEGKKDGQIYGIAILNHPHSINYPTYWMTRGYGLFAANPLGQLVYQQYHQVKDSQEFKLTLQPGDTAAFKFKVVIYEDSLTAEEVDDMVKDYHKS